MYYISFGRGVISTLFLVVPASVYSDQYLTYIQVNISHLSIIAYCIVEKNWANIQNICIYGIYLEMKNVSLFHGGTDTVMHMNMNE